MNLNALSKEKQLAEHRFELVHPVSGEPLGVFMSVVSAKSDKAQRFAEKQLRQEQMRELENAKSRKPKFKGLGDMIAESRAMAIDRLNRLGECRMERKTVGVFRPECGATFNRM